MEFSFIVSHLIQLVRSLLHYSNSRFNRINERITFLYPCITFLCNGIQFYTITFNPMNVKGLALFKLSHTLNVSHFFTLVSHFFAMECSSTVSVTRKKKKNKVVNSSFWLDHLATRSSLNNFLAVHRNYTLPEEHTEYNTPYSCPPLPERSGASQRVVVVVVTGTKTLDHQP